MDEGAESVNGAADGGAATDRDLFGRPPRGRRDWSHRRGEPRGLALAWTTYLMVATIGSLSPLFMASRLTAGVYRPAARLLAASVLAGMCVLWPMLRVAQAPQRTRAGVDVTRDLLVVLLPSVALLWPQVYMASWDGDVVLLASGVYVAWGLFAGSVLVWWHRLGGGAASRVAVVCVCLGVVAGLPLALARGGVLSLREAGPGVSAGWMWTPLTSLWELVRDRSWTGRPAAVGPGHVTAVRVLLGAACAVYVGTLWSGSLVGARLSVRSTHRES